LTLRGYLISHSASGKVMLDLSFTSEGASSADFFPNLSVFGHVFVR
jgi:hypothetical protein